MVLASVHRIPSSIAHPSRAASSAGSRSSSSLAEATRLHIPSWDPKRGCISMTEAAPPHANPLRSSVAGICSPSPCIRSALLPLRKLLPDCTSVRSHTRRPSTRLPLMWRSRVATWCRLSQRVPLRVSWIERTRGEQRVAPHERPTRASSWLQQRKRGSRAGLLMQERRSIHARLALLTCSDACLPSCRLSSGFAVFSETERKRERETLARSLRHSRSDCRALRCLCVVGQDACVSMTTGRDLAAKLESNYRFCLRPASRRQSCWRLL